MIIIAENKQENALVEQLAKEHHASAWRREDSYAIVRWAREDVMGVKPELNKEQAEAFLESFENNIRNLIVAEGFQALSEMDASGFAAGDEGNTEKEAFVPDEELVNIWLEDLLKEKGKDSPDDLTAEEILEAIEETKGTISNERLWAHADAIHWENLANLWNYVDKLTTLLQNKGETT